LISRSLSSVAPPEPAVESLDTLVPRRAVVGAIVTATTIPSYFRFLVGENSSETLFLSCRGSPVLVVLQEPKQGFDAVQAMADGTLA
jgi:hypothetical protein